MFSPETTDFLADLKANNTRDWFDGQRQRYARVMKEPARAFADSLAALLGARHGTESRARVFRVNRDLRFSKDKTPYNAHIHISASDGDTPAAWMFGLEPDRLVLGYGCFAFPGPELARWREAVAGRGGQTLAEALGGGPFRLEDPELRRVPAPHAQDHPRADLLRRKGLCVWLGDAPRELAFGDEAPGLVAERLGQLDAVRQWLISAVFSE